MKPKEGSIKVKPARHSFLPARRTGSHGGTIINIITAIIFFGLIAFAVLWVIKNIGQNIQIYAMSNDSFPPSLEALIEFSGSTQLFQCPDPKGGKYVYIPGQNSSMPPANILVYETNPVHDGRCGVLRLDLQIELLSPEQAQQAVAQTLAGLR